MKLPANLSAGAVGLGLLALILFGSLPLVLEGYLLTLAILMLQYAYLGQSWNIMTGIAGQLSLGHAIYLGLGAYTLAVVSFIFGINVWVGLIAGTALGFVAGAVIGFVGFRFALRGIYFALLTLAIAEFARIAFDNFAFVGGSSGFVLKALPADNVPLLTLRGGPALYFYIYLALNLAALAISAYLARSKTGYLLRAIRADEDAARALGVRTFRLKVLMTAISGAMTALGGGIFFLFLGGIYPETVFSFPVSINILLGPVIGGLGTLTGPIIGGFAAVALGHFTTELAESFGLIGLNTLVYGIVLMIVVLLMPDGIWPRVQGLLRRRGTGVVTSAAEEGVALPKLAWPTADPSKALLEVENASKTFGGVAAVRDVSFQVPQGGIFALIGPNGAGKTTCFNLVAGGVPASSGSIRFEGHELVGATPEQVCAAGLCRTFQIVRPFGDMTLLENVMVGAFLHMDRVAEARAFALSLIREFGLEGSAGTVASHLTLPDRKLLELVRAVATQPKLLLLDEVMAGLRPSEYAKIIAVLRRLNDAGLTILLIEHHMRVVMSLAQRVVVLHHGEKLVEGTPAEVTSDPKTIQYYLGRQGSHA